jgi:cytochrome P450
MHRRTDIYGPDALEFKPERWETLRPGWAYLPFNGGPRICVGQQFALTEAGYTIVRLMQEFDRIENREEGSGLWEEQISLTLSSHNGVQVGMYGR